MLIRDRSEQVPYFVTPQCPFYDCMEQKSEQSEILQWLYVSKSTYILSDFWFDNIRNLSNFVILIWIWIWNEICRKQDLCIISENSNYKLFATSKDTDGLKIYHAQVPYWPSTMYTWETVKNFTRHSLRTKGFPIKNSAHPVATPKSYEKYVPVRDARLRPFW